MSDAGAVADCIRALLALAVLIAWVAALGFARLRTPLERLHVVTFLNIVLGATLLLAAGITDGPSVRMLKSVLMWVGILLSGALLSHACARTLRLRDAERR